MKTEGIAKRKTSLAQLSLFAKKLFITRGFLFLLMRTTLLLLPFTLCFFAACSSSPEKNNVAAAAQPLSDSMRVDSIAHSINNAIFDTAHLVTVSKTFDCGGAPVEGNMRVYYKGKDVVWVTRNDCGDDHGGTSFYAAFRNGKLIYFSQNSGSWVFEDLPNTPDNQENTLDQTDIKRYYFENGSAVKMWHSSEKLHMPSKKKETVSDSTYFVHNDGMKADSLEQNLQQWIQFANSEKDYSAFFNEK